MNIAIPKNNFNYRGSSTQIQNKILSKEELFESQNNKDINNSNLT